MDLRASVQNIVPDSLKVWISNGLAEAPSEKTFVVLDPSNGLEVARLPFLLSEPATRDDLGHDSSAYELRAQCLSELASFIRHHQEDFARLIAIEGGKPIRQARVEAERAAETLRLSYSECVQSSVTGYQAIATLGDTLPAKGKSIRVERNAHKSVFGILAFNHPLNLCAHVVGPALAVGAPLLLKPALDAPLCSIVIWSWVEQFYQKHGFASPLGIALISNEETGRLASERRWGVVHFTGSSSVGWRLRSQVQPGVRVVLEHGGSAPVLFDQMPFDSMASGFERVFQHAYAHSGQVCVSAKRIFVHDSIFELACDWFSRKVSQLKTGFALDEDTDCGPLIREKETVRVIGLIDDATQKGAKLLAEGKIHEKVSGGFFVRPTLLANVAPNARIASEEVFGPVLCLESYRDFSSAIERANAVPWSFQASVYSQSEQTIQTCVERLNCAQLMVNEGPSFRTDAMPFAGHGESGLGVGGVAHTCAAFTEPKLVISSL